MTGFAVDTDKLGSVAGVGSLKCSGIFEAVGGHYTVVVVGSGHKYSRIGCAIVADVMHG